MKTTNFEKRLKVRTNPTIWDIRSSLWPFRTRQDGSAFSATIRGAIGMHYSAQNDTDHLLAAMKWLCLAQDATADDGVAALYDIRSGTWGPSYPETTGYIIPTFFDFSAYSGDLSYKERALRMANWLLTLQLDNGAFPVGPLWENWERKPIVFDTGQIIFGLVRAYKESGNSQFLVAAKRAGDWLVDIQEKDGSWKRFTSLDIVHSYNVRVAWALIELSEISQKNEFRVSATKNINWVLSHQDHVGWIEHMSFRPDEDPLTHTIAYTIRGILESGIRLENQSMINAVRLSALKLIEQQKNFNYLRARYGSEWYSENKWLCPTGTAQIAIIWLKLFEILGEKEYFEAAATAIHHLKQTQPLLSKIPGVNGGLSGSYPIYGDYEPYRQLNWATKFFADSLLSKILLEAGKAKQI